MDQLALFDAQNAPTYGKLGTALVVTENTNKKGWITSKVFALPGRKRAAELNQLTNGKADREKVDAVVKELAEQFAKAVASKVGSMNADKALGLVPTKFRMKKNGGYSLECNPIATLMRAEGKTVVDPKEAIRAMLAKGMSENDIMDILEEAAIEREKAIEVEATSKADTADPAATEHSIPVDVADEVVEAAVEQAA